MSRKCKEEIKRTTSLAIVSTIAIITISICLKRIRKSK